MRAPLLAGVLMLACLPAFGHSWYDPYCCNSNDCKAISPDDVVTGPKGYDVTVNGQSFHVPYGSDRIKQSQDADFHACEYPAGTLRCFYVPGGGV